MFARLNGLKACSGRRVAARVLEIGTGSGYQTAILAHLVQHVCSVERIKGLQWQARRRLKNLDLHNVSTRHGDGWQGWKARAPFDAIIVTAAPPEIPTALMTQLDEGGILVLPVGEEHQYLKRVRRRGGEFIIDTVEAVWRILSNMFARLNGLKACSGRRVAA